MYGGSEKRDKLVKTNQLYAVVKFVKFQHTQCYQIGTYTFLLTYSIEWKAYYSRLLYKLVTSNGRPIRCQDCLLPMDRKWSPGGSGYPGWSLGFIASPMTGSERGRSVLYVWSVILKVHNIHCQLQKLTLSLIIEIYLHIYRH